MTKETPNFDRLLMVADMLDDLPNIFPKPRFDLSVFIIGELFGTAQAPKCGTTACALGFASLYKPFQDLGLKAVFDGDNDFLAVEGIDMVFNIKRSVVLGVFDYLFMDFAYERGNRRDVSQRIRKFVANGGKIPTSFETS